MSYHVIYAEWKSITNYGKFLSLIYTKYRGDISYVEDKKIGGVD